MRKSFDVQYQFGFMVPEVSFCNGGVFRDDRRRSEVNRLEYWLSYWGLFNTVARVEGGAL